MKGLKEKRLELGLKPINLSNKLNISLQAIYNYEKGKRFPKKEILDRLTNFFECTIDDLL